jgi:hypothetical protein
VFLDVVGVGAGICDRLNEMGFGAIVRTVNFGSSPLEPPPRDEHGAPAGGPLNRRTEMWMKWREWLEDPAGVQIPDLDSLQADACGPTYIYDSNSRLTLEAKDHMRTRREVARRVDAVALTFAEPVAAGAGFGRRLQYPVVGVARGIMAPRRAGARSAFPPKTDVARRTNPGPLWARSGRHAPGPMKREERPPDGGLSKIDQRTRSDALALGDLGFLHGIRRLADHVEHEVNSGLRGASARRHSD